MLIHAVWTLPHYLRHLQPIMDELHARGHDVVGFDSRRARIDARPAQPDVTLVASHQDAMRVRGDRRVVYLEHGVGQTYNGRPDSVDAPGWPGGAGLDHVDLFLCPSSEVVNAWERRYSAACAVAIGCPALDTHEPAQRRPRAPHEAPIVAISFRWHCDVAPEASSAFPFYEPYLEDAVAGIKNRTGAQVVGHGHPRMLRRLERAWRSLGLTVIEDFDSLLDVAAVFVADNTSAMYEFAALDKPVVALNAPWYDRSVEHGLRFWSHVPGVMIDDPIDLPAAVDIAITDPAPLRALRSRAARRAYAAVDGRARIRAADAIEELTR